MGGWIEVRRGSDVMRREMTVGGGHVSGQAGWYHFGLGDLTETEIRVLWPDGEAGEWSGVDAGGFYLYDRDAGVTPWTPQ